MLAFLEVKILHPGPSIWFMCRPHGQGSAPLCQGPQARIVEMRLQDIGA